MAAHQAAFSSPTKGVARAGKSARKMRENVTAVRVTLQDSVLGAHGREGRVGIIACKRGMRRGGGRVRSRNIIRARTVRSPGCKDRAPLLLLVLGLDAVLSWGRGVEQAFSWPSLG